LITNSATSLTSGLNCSTCLRSLVGRFSMTTLLMWVQSWEDGLCLIANGQLMNSLMCEFRFADTLANHGQASCRQPTNSSSCLMQEFCWMPSATSTAYLSDDSNFISAAALWFSR
jgi:hypothetical protein